MNSDHCFAMAMAISGNVLERYFPRELRTYSFGFGYCISGINGGRFLTQYNVFLVYLTPNHDGSAKKSGDGRFARLIGIGFSTATYGAFALRQRLKNFAPAIILAHLSLLMNVPSGVCLTNCTLDTLQR